MDRAQVNRCPFAIGIYQGETLQQLRPFEAATTPVFTKDNVRDFKANFVADPFLVSDGRQWVLFFETKPINSKHGQIAYATSPDLCIWSYGGLVEGIVDSESHVSYPHVFFWDDEWWMIPETEKSGVVSLFRAVSFPKRWKRHADLLEGNYCDSTPFQHDGHWYLMSSERYTLRLWHAGSPLGYWREHPASPLRVGDREACRPAGRVVTQSDFPVRFAQDCAVVYGLQVFGFQITQLTSVYYEERPLGKIVGPGESGAWNQHGMHHVDAHPWNGGWIAAVDGR
jgi:hypothetical protein